MIISASRRTDLARCFPEVLAKWLAEGMVVVRNPFNGLERKVDLKPEAIHTLVLWSKDYARLLANEYELRNRLQKYQQLYFHLTITGQGGRELEPGINPPEMVARQFEPLVKLAGDPRRVNWRFDPIVIWKQKWLHSNLRWFDQIASPAAAAGIKYVTVSLCQAYAKMQRRFKKHQIQWVAPKPGRLKSLAQWLVEHARRFNLEVRACCCPELVQAGIQPARCVDGEWLSQLHPAGKPAQPGKDLGQRPHCGCTPSIDIGDYHLSCPEGCWYCYANPRT